jgi:hypothetical protein
MQFQQTANCTSLVDFIKQKAAIADNEDEWAAIFNLVRGIQDTKCPFCGRTFGKKNNRNSHVKICKKTGKKDKSKMETNYQVQVRLGNVKREEISVHNDKNKAAVAATAQAPVHTPPTANQE